MSNTIVVSRCQCKPGSEKDFLKAAEAFLVPSRKEPGCVSYAVYANTRNPGGFIFHEIWKDQDAINFHIASAHFGTFMGAAGTLLQKMKGDSPFLVTIAQDFDPANPPQGDEIVVSSLCEALPGKADEIVRTAPALILDPSAAEAGCKGYDLYRSLDNPGSFILYEVWKGFSAIQSHMGTPHFGAFIGAAGSLFKPVADGQFFRVMICHPYG
jgi:quinol monooxygenase YgiN